MLSVLTAIAAAALITTGALGATEETIKSVDPNDGWRLTSKKDGVILYARVRAGSHLKEFKAIAEIDAPTPAVNALLNDFDSYPKFMPYVVESRLIKDEGESIVAYQRLSPKICEDRDYTLRIRKTRWNTAEGITFMHQWTPANELGPPEKKGVVRVKTSEGAWLLEPIAPGKTRATYWLYSDTGGAIPSFMANYASQTGIDKLFNAVRKEVTDPKYQEPAEKTEH